MPLIITFRVDEHPDVDEQTVVNRLAGEADALDVDYELDVRWVDPNGNVRELTESEAGNGDSGLIPVSPFGLPLS